MEFVTVFLLTVVFLAWILYRRYSKPYDYWKDLGIPFVPPIPILGSYGSLLLSVSHETEIKWYEKYGRIYGYYEGNRPRLTVADPELLKKILVKDFQFFTTRRDFTVGDPLIDNMTFVLHGDDWKRVRTIITPAFSTGKMKKMFSAIKAGAKTLSDSFAEKASLGQPIDARKYFGAFVMDVIASAAFATKIDSQNDPKNPFVVAANTTFNRKFPWRFFLLFMFPGVMKTFGIRAFGSESFTFFRKITLEIIKERTRTGKTGYNDFLQLMMEAVKESEEGKGQQYDNKVVEEEEVSEEQNIQEMGHEEINESIFKQSNYRNKGLSFDEVVANCVMFFFAGYDTTATMLSLASYMLALNPSVQEKLIADVDENIKQHENELSYDAIQSMKYLDMVVSETLRMFPVALRVERVADEDYPLGDTGIVVKKGMLLGAPVYAMQHDPEFYPDPEMFIPERFTTEEKAKRHSYVYMPFGAGPRNCLGMRFALFEMKICLAYLFSQFRLKKCPQTKVPLEFYPGNTVLQPKSIIIGVDQRKDKIIKL